MTARGWLIALGVPISVVVILTAWGLADAAVRGHWPFQRRAR
jgi:hypothetical protein